MIPLSSSTASSRSSGNSKTSKARSVAFKLVPHAVLLLVLSVIVLAPKYTLFAWNYTPSMPEGLYVRAIIDTPAVGKIIAFPAPTSVVEYTRRRGRTEALPLLAKSLAAGPGDHVCVTDHLTINDQRIAPVLENGPDGVPLPRWRECRQLGSGEWFAYADRIPNSLDSRYYGPVHQSEIVGVFRPLWTADN